MQVHVLGYGPITRRLLQHMRRKYDARIYTSRDSLTPLPEDANSYQDFLKLQPNQDDAFILAWRGFPEAASERHQVMRHLQEISSKDNFLVNLSSVAVYGSTKEPATESQPARPINNYGNSKLRLEQYCIEQFGNISCHLRISNVYGDPGFNDIVNRLVKAAIKHEPINLVSPKRVQRDFISIGEVVRAIEHVIDMSAVFQENEIFNLSSGVSITLDQLRCVVERLIGCEINFTEEETAEELITKSLISNSKLEEFLGYPISANLATLEPYILSII